MQNLHDVQRATTAIRQRLPQAAPRIALILGTGLGGLAEGLSDTESISYEEIPDYPLSTVDSHAGRFLLGKLQNIPVIVQQGRCHLYEGYSAAQVSMGVRIMHSLGARSLVITNAAGAINPQFDAGELMLISDHINTTATSPLEGNNVAAWGSRFPDMNAIYDQEYRKQAEQAALSLGITLHRGVYVGVRGPQMETPAETRAYRHMGGDAVGMSTVLEAIAACHLGMRILGISCLTNKNLPDCMAPAPLEEVIQTANRSGSQLASLLKEVVTKL